MVLKMNRNDEHPFRIAIVGGGLGGLFTALCIHHHCAKANVHTKIDVYEQASQYKEIGAGLGLGANASRFLHEVGIGGQLNAISGLWGGNISFLVFRRFDNSEDIVNLPVKEDDTVRQAACARSELLELFKTTIEERGAATLHTKKSCWKVKVCHTTHSAAPHSDILLTGSWPNRSNQLWRLVPCRSRPGDSS